MKNKAYEPNPGVGCDVTNCKYNTIDCRCSASRISVQNEKAASKGGALLLHLLPQRHQRLTRLSRTGNE